MITRMNRKGNTAVSIVILVVLIMALACAVLFIFYTNNSKNSLLLGNAGFIEKSVMEKEKAEFIIGKIAESNIKKAKEGSDGKDIAKIMDKFEKLLYADLLEGSLDFEKSEQLQQNIKDGKSRIFIDENDIVFDSGEMTFTTTLALRDEELVLIGLTKSEELEQHLGVIYRTNVTIRVRQ